MRAGGLLVLVIGILLAGGVRAADVPRYAVGADFLRIENFDVRYVEDPDQTRGVAEIADAPGRIRGTRFYLPPYDANHWFVFTLVNDSARPVDRIIRLDEVYVHDADLFFRSANGWTVLESGVSRPIGERQIANRAPVFLVSLAPGAEQTFYLKVSSYLYLLTFDILVESPEKFLEREQTMIMVYFLFMGAALAILLYNIFLLVSLRDRLYLFYVLHAGTSLAWLLLYSGFDFYLTSSLFIRYEGSVAICLSSAFLTLFTRELLNTAERTPRLDKLLLVVVALFLIEAVLVAFDVRYYYILVLLGMPTMLVLFGVGLYHLYKGYLMARYYVFITSWYLLGLFMVAGVNLGVLPYNVLTRFGVMGGSLIELVGFSLVLAYRIKLLQEEKLAVQQRLVDAEQAAKEDLEDQVAERTRELAAANGELARLARLDGLTGLFNRRAFDAALGDNWARPGAAPLTLILADIDHFKAYNDHYGHLEGDACLRAVADILRRQVLRAEGVAARYGGEEFAILLPGRDLAAGCALAEAIRAELGQHERAHAAVGGRVTMSFGVASRTPDPSGNPADLIAEADARLYASKKAGRDRVTGAA